MGISLSIFLLSIYSSCIQKSESYSPLLRLVPNEKSGVNFSNTLYEDEQLNIINFEYFYNGSGVGIADVNNDGLQDLFFSGNMTSCKLFLNKGNFTFEDITASSGIDTQGSWATGVAMVDINQDEYIDIYVCLAGPYESSKRKNIFYINQGDNTFTDQAAQMGLDDDGHTTQAAFFDYDNDGDLDVYLLTNITDRLGPNVIRPKKTRGESPNTDRLYKNEHGFFTNISQEAGITLEGYGLGVSIRDINDDSWPDIYVSNDYLSNDLVYINNQDGTFTDHAAKYFQHTSYSAMGNDIADINNDGLQDVITVDMLPPDNIRRKLMINSINYDRHRSEIISGYQPQFVRNTLQLNRGISPTGIPAFSEIGQMLGIHSTDWSWSVLGVDLDNDSDKDLMITNGYPRDITNLDFVAYKMSELTQANYDPQMNQAFVHAINSIEGAYLPNYLFENTGELSFQDQSEKWGFTHPSFSHGAAVGDLDNDGDLDVVITNTKDPAFIYENTLNEKSDYHYIRIQLQGPEGNSMGLGSKITIYHDSVKQFSEFSTYRGFQSSVEPISHFGLGTSTFIDSLIIIWPDNRIERQYNIPADQKIIVTYTASEFSSTDNHPDIDSSLFVPTHDILNLIFKHQEQHYADFKIQPLIPHKFSQAGPGITSGDINGDQLEDIFVGGAFDQSGQIFIQQPDHTFLSNKLSEGTSYEEDMGSLFFDADNDGDTDLYVVSGGSEFKEGSEYYQDRIYKNNGNGKLVLDDSALPKSYTSGSCVVGNDIDQDGDVDLFIGGKLTPNSYPQPGRSVILQNMGGSFRDITEEVCPGLQDIGMVNAAIWSDINTDGKKDLIVVGEWMAITIFINEGEMFTNKTNEARCHFTELNTTSTLAQTVGWWNSITGADIDQDGDIDYILGNLGLNTPLKTSFEEPVSLYVNDFNMDDRQDPILCHYLEGKEVPYHPKDDMVQQMYTLRKITPSYTDYAQATWKDLFPSEVIDYAKVYRAHTFESVYLENKGNLEFELSPLPKEAQMSPVFGIEILDTNQDTYPDVLLSGNSYATETMSGRYDAFQGMVLLGNGHGQFLPCSLTKSGWYLPNDEKGLITIPVSNRPHMIAVSNNDTLKSFSLRSSSQLTWMPLDPSIQSVNINYENGKQELKEIYLGSGYLSHSASGVWLHNEVKNITLKDIRGNTQQIIHPNKIQ